MLLYSFTDFPGIGFGNLPGLPCDSGNYKWWYDKDQGIYPLSLNWGRPGPFAIPLGLDYYLVYLGASQV